MTSLNIDVVMSKRKCNMNDFSLKDSENVLKLSTEFEEIRILALY